MVMDKRFDIKDIKIFIPFARLFLSGKKSDN
jgi:hypothetical protein